jgi:integration host factor subunit alpha
MALTKQDLIEATCSKCNLTKKHAADVVENLIETIKRTREQGEGVLISGFGKFDVKEKNVRRGRNPVTGTDLMLDGRRVVRFKCSGVLKLKLDIEKKKQSR